MAGRRDTASDTLDQRALNRATLARNLLLERSELSVVDAVDHLVGMQAQLPLNPYIGLWSRLESFRPDDLTKPFLDRELVRIVVMRGTIHLVTADDCLLLRPLVQPVLDAELARHPDYGPHLRDLDLGEVLEFARTLLAMKPLTGPQLRRALHEGFPAIDAAALAYACRNHLAIVQVPPRGVWGRSAQVTVTTAESWLGRSVRAAPSIDDVVIRYLGAYGPSTVADVAAWSRLTGFRAVLERLRPRLRTFYDERGRELFDLPDAPRPDRDTPAPPRLLPEYDNVLLSHADRSRFAPPAGQRMLSMVPSPMRGPVLYDGLVVGTWWLRRGDGGAAIVTVRAITTLARRAVQQLTAESRRLGAFIAPDASAVDVRVELP